MACTFQGPASRPHPSTTTCSVIGNSLVALGHLQVAEVGDALHVGMEGKEATQEVVPSQVEVGVLYQLGWLRQSMQQEKQQVECPCLGPHASEVTALEDARPHCGAGHPTARHLHRHLHSDNPAQGQADILKGSEQGTETGAGYICGALWGLHGLGEHSIFITWLHPAFCLSSYPCGHWLRRWQSAVVDMQSA